METISYCGIKCLECPIYISTINNNYELKNEIIEKWKYKGKIDIEQIQCHGCKSNEVFRYCSQCDIKKCCIEKNKNICEDCKEYICSRLMTLYKNCNEYFNKMN